MEDTHNFASPFRFDSTRTFESQVTHSHKHEDSFHHEGFRTIRSLLWIVVRLDEVHLRPSHRLGCKCGIQPCSQLCSHIRAARMHFSKMHFSKMHFSKNAFFENAFFENGYQPEVRLVTLTSPRRLSATTRAGATPAATRAATRGGAALWSGRGPGSGSQPPGLPH